MQDLTPQLRTRLSRVERAVGVFVALATLLLAAGFCYYVYHTAKRKGWFVTKVPYYTFLDNALGLKVGDPVKLLGFDVGEITRIDSMPPEDPNNIYIEFEVRSPYFGYLWSDSEAHITSADFLGKRVLEVTKGVEGIPTYLNFEIADFPVKQVLTWKNLEEMEYGAAVWSPDQRELLASVEMSLTNRVLLQRLDRLGIASVRVIDRQKKRKGLTGIWDGRQATNGSYIIDRKLWYKEANGVRRLKPYPLVRVESPAVTERLQRLLSQIEKALPGVFNLTNHLAAVLTNTATLTAQAEETLRHTQPILSNVTLITAQLRDPNGTLGQWLLPTNLHAQLLVSLTNANGTLTNASAALAAANTNLVLLVSSLEPPLTSLSLIISNFNTQVEANSNFVTHVSTLLVHLDDLIQGFKRHWLLRSAFKEKPTNAPPRRVAPPTTGRR